MRIRGPAAGRHGVVGDVAEVGRKGEMAALVGHGSGFRGPNAQSPARLSWALSLGSLAVSYFHTGIRTIIGAEAFHGPVRNGKAWDHLAMATRHKLYKLLEAITSKFTYWPVESCISLSLHVAQSDSNDRIKPHEQLVSVSLTPHSASTPDLSTSWSRTTLQGGQASREVSSSGKFPA